MTSHREWFTKYEEYNGGKVYLASDSTLEIVGHGRVRIQFPDEATYPNGLGVIRVT
jgi:hypothetical protein